MSNKEQDELMKKLSEALSHDGEEVTVNSQEGADGMQVLNINKRPAGDPTWYTAEDGSMVVDWKEKFDRQQNGQHPPFQFGEKVLISGFVESDPDGAYKLHVDADGRLADNFYIATVPREDPLKDLVGMPLEAIVDVVDERESKWQISNIQNYDARLVEVTSKPVINPTQDQIEALEKSKRVVVKGKFLGFDESPQDRFLQSLGLPKGSSISGSTSAANMAKLTISLPNGDTVEKTVYNPPKGYYENSTSGIVETEDGQRINVRMPTGRINFTGGVLECLTVGKSSGSDRKNPEVGDYVRIGAFVTSKEDLAAHSNDPCLLDEPSEARMEKYSRLRSNIKDKLRKLGRDVSKSNARIRKKKLKRARNLIGDLRASELTSDELSKIRRFTSRIPESERSVQTPVEGHNRDGRRHFFAEYIDNAYETRLEGMTKSEFIDFAHSAVTGQRKQTGRHADTSYLFALAQDFGIDKGTRENLITNCIETRLGRIRGKPYEHDRDFDDKYNVEQGLKYLAHVGTESSANKVFDYLRSFVDEGDYHEKGWRDKDRSQLPETFVFPAVEAISSHIEEMPREVVRSQMPYLQQVASYLSEFADEPVTLGVLNRTIDYFNELDSE